MLHKIAAFLFALVVLGDLIAVTVNLRWLEIACKPVAMPLLILWMLSSRMKQDGFSKKIVAALIFSCFGDVALLFQHEVPTLFLVGLGSFLIAHLFYATAFYQLAPNSPLFPKGSDRLRAILLIAYGFVLYNMLFPYLDAVLKVAVFIYAAALTGMALFCLKSKSGQQPQTFSWLMSGAMLFVLSDSMLALDKFIAPLPWGGLLIMSTYLAAQFCIAKGSLAKIDSEAKEADIS